MPQPPQTKGRHAIPGLPDAEDQSLAMITALASELAVARERIDTLERLLVQAGVFEAHAVEAYEPDAAAAAQRDALRRRIIDRVFRPVREAARRAAQAIKGA